MAILSHKFIMFPFFIVHSITVVPISFFPFAPLRPAHPSHPQSRPSPLSMSHKFYPRECKAQYGKWSSHRTYTHDPQTCAMVGELPEVVGGAGWREAKGEKSGQLY